MGRNAFEMDFLKVEAAVILAYADNSAEKKQEAADAAGVTVRTIEIWLKRQPLFSQLVKALREQYAKKVIDQAEASSLANFDVRMGVLDDMNDRLGQVVAARAETYKDDPIPGKATGLVVTEMKATGPHHAVDTGLVTARKELVALANKMVEDLTGNGEGASCGIHFIVD